MGVDYYQKAIVGVKFSIKEIKRVVSPAVYEDQPRYDTKTGKVKSFEKVLVKEEEAVWTIGKFEWNDPYDIKFKGANGSNLDIEDYTENGEILYIGLNVPIDKSRDFYDGSISIDDLINLEFKVKEEFRKLELYDLVDKIKLHFFTNVSF